MNATFWRLMKFVLPFWKWVALAVLMGSGTITASIGLMSASAWIIAMAALHPSIAVLQVAIVGVRFFGIARGVFRYFERIVSHQVTFRLLARLRVWFYEALEPLAPARLMQFHSGDLLARIVGDIETLENFYVRVLAPPLVAAVIALGAAVFLAQYDLSLGAALLALLVVGGTILPVWVRYLSRPAGQAVIAQRARLNQTLVDGIQGLPDLLAYRQGTRQLAMIEETGRSLARAQRRLAWVQGLQSAFGSLLSNLGMWIILVLAIPLVRSGQIDGPALAVVALAALTSFEAVLPLPLAAQLLDSSLEAARRLFEVVDTAPAVAEPAEPLPVPAQFRLDLKDVQFAYESGRPALNGVSFSLEPGKRLAVVGPSGAGKSTLVNLLLRYWDPQGGEIRLDGIELDRYSPEAIRKRIGVVSQRTYLFNATVRDNLLIARPGASQAELEAAAKTARLHDFIQSLPDGYDTWIGEQGLRLSGGERQRLALARTLLKDPPLLILDEATANLDPLTERQVLDAIEILMQGRTTLMITHRLTGLEAMDEILVLDRGRLVERGQHADLMAYGGLYRRLWDLQRQVIQVA